MRRSPAAAIAAATLLAALAPAAGAAQDAPAGVAAPAPSAQAATPTPAEAAPPGPAIASPEGAAAAAATAAPSPEAPASAAAAAAPSPEAPASAAPAEGAATPAGAPGPDPSAAATAVEPAGPDPLAAGSLAGSAPLAAPAAAAAAEAVAAPAAASAQAAAPRKPRRTLPLIGFSLGAGFPDLANANLLVRPLDWIRVYAGPCWSSLSWGFQGGVVLSPLNWYVTPTLSFQAGKLLRTNASRYVKDEEDSDAKDFKPLLERLDYHYYAGDLGLELGSPRGFNFFLRFGLSFVVVKANGTASHTDDDGTVVSIRDPRVSAWLPSAKLGFQYWF